MGRPWQTLDAVAYHAAKPELREVVLDALAALRARYDVILLEGAGSPAELNLLDHDLVNLGLASAAGVPAVVVGDIDRGGVFAALYGTVALLPDDLRRWVRGFLINKFRGDAALLEPGITELEQRSGLPCIGVLPFVPGLSLDAEDSLGLHGALRGPNMTNGPASLDVALVALPAIANFTDLTVDGQNVQDQAQTAAENLISGNPNAQVLYATGEPALIGLIAAVSAQGATDRVKIFGWDLSAQAIKGIDQGFVQAVVQQDPEGEGKAAVGAALKLIAKQPVEKNISVPVTIVTKANVAKYRDIFK